MIKAVLLVALFGVALSMSAGRLARSEDNILRFPLDNGTVLVQDLSEPAPETRAVDSNKVIFTLYQRSNKNTGFQLKTGDTTNLKNSGFNKDWPTKIIIHGYTHNGQSESVQSPKNAYLESGDYNIIGVDYGEYSNQFYPTLVSNAKPIAECIGKLVAFLNTNGMVSISKLHIMGHSLGAHVAGFVGAYTGSSTKVGRVTGFDPAGPLFGTSGVSGRLDSGDADFVDVIHSCIQSLGISYSIGHCDFWPNGGTSQARCAQASQPDGCDHAESVRYFVDTIKNRVAYPAKSCTNDKQAKDRACTGATPAHLGEDAQARSPPGIYYVDMDSILR